MNGVINFLKPPGLSSAQAVAFVKKIIGGKVGHAGTLDPEAAGVLPIMIGKATRLFDYIADDTKVYLAEISFGFATDTQDAQGNVIDTGKQIPTAEQLQSALLQFIGNQKQIPPKYSAVKRDGRPLYDWAKHGVDIPVEARDIRIDKIELVAQLDRNTFLIRVTCGKGTYIRTLCHDIGVFLNCPAHMRFLLRERVGDFALVESISPNQLKQVSLRDSRAWLIESEVLLSSFPRLDIPEAFAKRVLNGLPLNVDVLGEHQLAADAFVRMYLRGALIGVAQRCDSVLVMKLRLDT